MSDDVLTLMKAAQKERLKLVARLKILRKREGEIRLERTDAEQRLAQIDEAFAPIKQTLGAAKVVVAPTPTRPTTISESGQMGELVVAIGKYGLRDFTPRDLIRDTPISSQSIYALLSQLAAHGRIRRIQPGVYRTAQAKIA